MLWLTPSMISIVEGLKSYKIFSFHSSQSSHSPSKSLKENQSHTARVIGPKINKVNSFPSPAVKCTHKRGKGRVQVVRLNNLFHIDFLKSQAPAKDLHLFRPPHS